MVIYVNNNVIGGLSMKKTIFQILTVSLVMIGLFFACTPLDNLDDDDNGDETATYNLRDTGPAGGLIFYDKGSYSDGWRYLEAAPSDQSIGVWIVGGATQTMENGNTLLTIGTGSANTTFIIGQTGHSDSAAQLCKEQVIGIYDDWFLPSLYELKKMYINLKSGTDENGIIYTPVGGFASVGYWSSSELSATHALAQGFNSGTHFGDEKSDAYNIRAVRAF